MTTCADCGTREATHLAALTADGECFGYDPLTPDRLARRAEYPKNTQLLCRRCTMFRIGYRWAVVRRDGTFTYYCETRRDANSQARAVDGVVEELVR